MSDHRPKGWHPDPYGIHEERFYYLDNMPGRLVRDGDEESYDDIPDDAPPIVVKTGPESSQVPDEVAPLDSPGSDRSADALPVAPDRPWVAADSGDESEARHAFSSPRPAGAPFTVSTWTTDAFPDEPIRYRTAIVEHLRRWWEPLTRVRLPRLSSPFALLPTLSRRHASAALGVVLAGLLALSLILILLPGTTPSSPPSSTPGRDRTTSTDILNGSAHYEWQVAESFPNSSLALNAVSCPSTQMCFAVGETTLKTGLVLFSSTSGEAWQQQSVPNGVGVLSSISCASTTRCMAVGGDEVIDTVNGGLTWSVAFLNSRSLTSVDCPTDDTCVVAGTSAASTSGCPSGTTFATVDWGLDWSPSSTPCFVPSSVVCIDDAKCEMTGTEFEGDTTFGSVKDSHSGGRKWMQQYKLTTRGSRLNDIACTGSSHCVAVGRSNRSPIIATSDSGTHWSPDPVSKHQGDYLSVSCESTLVCDAVGTAPPLATGSGGRSWGVMTFPSSVALFSGVDCPGVTQCVAVGDDQISGGITLRGF